MTAHRSLVLVVSVLFLSEVGLSFVPAFANPQQRSVRIAQQPEATPNTDGTAGKRTFQEGMQLFQQGTAESRRQAIEKWEEALRLFRAMDDRSWQALTLTSIGKVYSDLGEKQKALDYYNQALPLSRAVGNKAGEALTLIGIGRVYSDLGEKQKALDYYNQSLPLFRAVGDRKREAITLNNIGRVYDDLGEKQKALDYYNQALPLSRAVGDRAGEATTLNNIGLVYYSLGEKQKALDYPNQALPLFRAVGDRKREAITLNNIARVYSDLGEKQKALDYYNQALPLSRAVSDKAGEATTLNNIGKVYSDLGEKQKALDYYNQALPLRQAVSDKAGEATTLNNIGGVYDDLGQKQKTLDYLNQALALSRAVGDKAGEAGTLNNIGKVYSDLGQKQKALDDLNQALALSRAVGDRAQEATTLNNIGGVYDDLGQKQKALDYYNQALSLRQAVGDRFGEAITLNNIGKVYNDLGEKQKALDYYNQSLTLSRAGGDRAQEAVTLNNIGAVYGSLGEKQKALDYFNSALSLRQAVGDKSGEATTLNNIGKVYDDLGQKQRAFDYYNQALPLFRAVGDRFGEATTLNNIGRVYDDLGQKQKAFDYYNQALTLRQAVSDKAGEAGTLNNIGSVYYSLGENRKALDYFNSALPLLQAVGDRSGEAQILYNFAYLEGDRDNLNQALTQIKAAIEIVEDLRTKIVSQELRASYFASVQDYYELYIDILMRLHKQQPSKGYDAQALHVSERARARSLLELLTEANADIRQGVAPNLLQQERSLQQQLDAKEQLRVQILSGNHTPEQAAKIDKEIESLLAQYQQVRDEIRKTSPRYAALKYPQPLALPEIQQQVLDDNTLLLQYSLGEERSYLWLVTKTGITSYELPKRTDIEVAAKEFRQVLTDPILSQDTAEVAQKSAQLSQLILAPVVSQLGQKRLLIVGDGVLQYIPFAALSVSETEAVSPIPNHQSPVTNPNYEPLIVKHEIVYLPSASTLAILRRDAQARTKAAKTIAVLADPVFTANDERVKVAGNQENRGTEEPNLAQDLATSALERSARDTNAAFSRLKFTRQEAQAIMALVPEGDRKQEFDFNASRTEGTNPNLDEYRIVHFATHGILNPTHPELSGLVLSLVDKNGASQNGFLRLHDIFNLNLSAELVVLSACKTGSGQTIRGEGIVGLTRGFMYAGSSRVVASLWSVNDPATAVLMTQFYQRYLQEGLPAAAALRAAQIEMWKQQQWQAPYYWAAFMLQGEWQ